MTGPTPQAEEEGRTPDSPPADVHDRTLEDNVRPRGWINPTPAGRYNLVVLGAGAAGLVAAAGAAGLGAKVALIEGHLMGGDCLVVGCVPSKALIRSSRTASDVRDAARFGVRVPDGTSVDFPAVMERMRRLRAGFSPNDSAERFRGLGVDVFLGAGRFVGPDVAEVGGRTLRFARAIIATGSRPAISPIPGLAEAGYLTNETVFSLTDMPRRLAIIGAGPIGCELAQAFARFGASVALVQGSHPLLGREDRDAAGLVERSLRRDGVEILGDDVALVRRDGDARVLALGGVGESRELRVDAILVAVGRSPNTRDLGLDAAGVALNEVGVAVDDHLRTSNRRIFAAGDVCSRFKFTHAADAMARIAIRNALFLGREKVGRLIIPRCTYTDPEVAHVGLDESEAGRRGIRVRTFRQELGGVDRAVLDGETEGFVKVHIGQGSDEILGATVVARHAGEMLSELTLAIVGRVGLRTLARTIHPYPTQAEAIRKVADAYNRTRMTPLVHRVFERWLAWSR